MRKVTFSWRGSLAVLSASLVLGCGRGGPPPLPVVSVTATDPAASEGAADTGSFEIARTGDTSAELVVHFSIGGGMDIPAAINGVDYNDQATGAALETSATIPADAPSVEIVIEPIDDADVESAEGVTLTLSSAPGYTVAAAPDNWATVFIADDEPPQAVSISAPDPDADEKGTDPGTFRIVRGGDTTDALVVNFEIATGAGHATNGTDYNDQATGGPLGASATIPAGSASVDIVVVPVDDAEEEPTEAVWLTLVDDMAYSVAEPLDNTAAVFILDDDTPTVVSIAATGQADEQGCVPGTFEVTRAGRTDSALVVYFDVATGAAHATNGADYNDQATGGPLGASVTIPYGDSSVSVVILPVDDVEVESAETVTLTLVPDAAYVVAAPPANAATVSIADDDGPPFRYGPEVVTEYSWDGSSFLEETQRTYSYDAGGKVTGILERTWTGSAWADSARTTYAYNGDDTVDTITVESWDGFSWSVDSTTTCGYSGGRMTSRVEDDVTEGTITRTTFTYAGSLVTGEGTEESTDGGVTWSATGATDYVYDGQDRLSSGALWAPDPFLGGWMQMGDLSVTYDAGGRLDTQTIDVSVDLPPFFSMQMTALTGPATYDATGRLETMEIKVDIVVTAQEPVHEYNRVECFYDVAGRLQMVLQYEWNDGLADWDLIGRTMQTNTDAGSSYTFRHENATPLVNWPPPLYGCGDVNPHLWP